MYTRGRIKGYDMCTMSRLLTLILQFSIPPNLLNCKVFWRWWAFIGCPNLQAGLWAYHTDTWWNGLKIWKGLWQMINYNYIILHFSLLHKTKCCKHYIHTQIKEYLEISIYVHVVIYRIYLQNPALESYKMLVVFFFFFPSNLRPDLF